MSIMIASRTFVRGFGLVSVISGAAVFGCSAGSSDGGTPGAPDGTRGGSFGGATGSGAHTGIGGNFGADSGGRRSDRLLSHIEQYGLIIDVVVVACAGDCTDIEAVASGGYAPYEFLWEDGSTTAQRRVCPEGSGTSYSVTVTDSGKNGTEFPVPRQTATATVGSRALTCGDAGPPPPGDTTPPVERCVQNPSFERNSYPPGFAQDLLTSFDGDAWQACSTFMMARGEAPGLSPLEGVPAPPDGVSMVGITQQGHNGFGQRLNCTVDAANPLSLQFKAHAVLGGLVAPDSNQALELWMGTNACDATERVWVSPVMREDADGWATYCATLAPAQPATSLLFHGPFLLDGPTAIFIDDIVQVDACP